MTASETMRNIEGMMEKHRPGGVLDRVGLSPEQVRAMTKGPLGVPKKARIKKPQSAEEALAAVGVESRAVQAYVVRVSPELAEAWLGNNGGNRKANAGKIGRYAAMMRNGEWEQNGESVKFAEDGRLLDGQSRLMAVRKVGEPVWLEVRFGIPAPAQDTMDSGESRKIAHVLQMRGEVDCNNLAAALRSLWVYIRLGWGHGALTRNSLVGENYFSGPRALALLKERPGIRNALVVAGNPAVRRWLPKSRMAAFIYIIRQADPEVAKGFVEGLLHGAGLAPGSAVLAVRNRMNLFAHEDERVPLVRRLGVLVKGWNAFREGREVEVISMKADEPFPEVAGGEGKLKVRSEK